MIYIAIAVAVLIVGFKAFALGSAIFYAARAFRLRLRFHGSVQVASTADLVPEVQEALRRSRLWSRRFAWTATLLTALTLLSLLQ